MKKVKTFLQQFSHSLLPQSSHYQSFLQNRFSTSFVFFLKLQIFFSCIIISLLLLYINPFTLNDYKKSIVKSLNTIPSNFNVSVYNGELNTNLFRPFLFWVKLPTEQFLFLVIDEKANPEKINEYGSTFLLSKKSITAVYQKQIHVLPYPQSTEHIVLNKSDILKLSSQIMEKIKLSLIVFSPLLLLIIPLILFLITITYVFLSSVLVYIFYHLFHKHYKFTKILQIGLYSSSLPLLILTILFSLYFIRCTPIHLPLIIFLLFQLTGVYEAHYPMVHHKKK